MTRGGRPKERTFAVPAELARLRAELLAAFQAGQLARWAELTLRLKRALQTRRGEMLTEARLRDIEINKLAATRTRWKEAAE